MRSTSLETLLTSSILINIMRSKTSHNFSYSPINIVRVLLVYNTAISDYYIISTGLLSLPSD